MLIGVTGAKGFVGTQIVAALRKAGYEPLEITRETFYAHEARVIKDELIFDVLINCSMPSKRVWAENEPFKDFDATVWHTAHLVYKWKYKHFVQISSLSARCQLDAVYGRHKLAAEAVPRPGSLILRIPPMYGPGLSKGSLFGLLRDQPVYTARSTRYCFTPVTWIGQWVAANFHLEGLYEIGALEGLAFGEVADVLGSKSEFMSSYDPDQLISGTAAAKWVGPLPPNVREVIPWLEAEKEKLACATV
jgi:nucleoside-diphosphate-sugar epimerase